MARRSQPGFTLLEALVALVMFGILIFATSMALSAVLQAQSIVGKRQANSATVRAIFDVLTRDLRAAYGSPNSPASVFVSGAPGSGPTGISGGSHNTLLTLTTLTHRIEGDTTGGQGANAGASLGLGQTTQQAPQQSPPQSDCALVRYDLDSQNTTLTRLISSVPNLQQMTQATAGPDSIISPNVVALSFRFWDGSNWQTSWDYEQQAQAQNQSSAQAGGSTGGQASGGSGGQTGSGTGTPPGGNTAGQSGSGTGNASLPAFVEVTVTLRADDATTATYTTLVSIVAPTGEQKEATPQSQGSQNPQGGGSGP